VPGIGLEPQSSQSYPFYLAVFALSSHVGFHLGSTLWNSVSFHLGELFLLLIKEENIPGSVFAESGI
jgi:hypothetical protein